MRANRRTAPSRILLAEHDDAIRAPLANQLRLRGYCVEELRDARALANELAMLVFDPSRSRPTAIVSDTDMPDASGTMLLRALCRVGLRIPVVLMTRPESSVVRRLAVNAGCVAFLEEPFSVDALEAVLARAAQRTRREPGDVARGRADARA